MGKTKEETVQDLMKRVEANDAGAMYLLSNDYYRGRGGLQQDRSKGDELLTRAATLGSSQAHYQLGIHFDKGGVVKKAKFHYEAAAMAGHEMARYNLGYIEFESGNSDRAMKHWIIAASGGNHHAMNSLQIEFEVFRHISRDALDSVLTAYNTSCAEMRSEARDAYIQWHIDRTDER
jgi:TPR repeat protein